MKSGETGRLRASEIATAMIEEPARWFGYIESGVDRGAGDTPSRGPSSMKCDYASLLKNFHRKLELAKMLDKSQVFQSNTEPASFKQDVITSCRGGDTIDPLRRAG